MKLALLAAGVLSMGVAPALSMAAVAHADTSSYMFLSPSGNIGCEMEDDGGGNVFAVCKTKHRPSWSASPSEFCQQGEVPGATGGMGFDMQLLQGKSPCVGFSMTQFFFPPDPLANEPTLAYGQTHTIGAITCGSELAGVTCTDSSTGHLFRVASDSYQLG